MHFRRTKFMKKILIITILFSLAACQKPRTSVNFAKAGLYPEGLEYDEKADNFLVTSLSQGNVGKVTPDGKYSEFVKDDELVSAIGIRIDRKNNRILVCNSDPGASVKTNKDTQGKKAGLGIYDLATGKKTSYIDLGALNPDAGNFANDIALDDKGNIYVTNSFSPIIFQIGSDLKAKIFLQNDRFKGEGFGLNGIVYDEKGFLIVSKYNEGVLFKVPVNDPEKFTEVKLAEKIVGADGLLWGNNGNLIVNANASTNKSYEIKSKDNWESAEIVNSISTGEVFVTTGVKTKHGIFILYSMLNKLFDPNNKVPAESFTIQKLEFGK